MADLSKIKLNGTVYYLKDAWVRLNLPQEETMANVIAMLQEFGLDTTTTLEPGVADIAHADSLVLTQ